MSNISPSPSFAPVEDSNMWSTALDMPFSPLKTFAWGIDQGGNSSFGLGTALRGATTPAGNEPPPLPTGNPITDAINAPAAIRAGVEGIGRLISGEQNPPMLKDAYEASPYFRKAIPWDPGMTEDRAAALASNYDIQTAKDYFGSKDRTAYLAGSFVGQAMDPINFLPVFGEAAQTAAVLKFGVNAFAELGVRAGFGAAEAAGNTALFGALTAEQRAKYGDDVSWQAQINNIAMAAVIGGVLSPIAHAVGIGVKTLADMRADASVQSKVETVPNVATARAITNDAVTGLATEGEVRLSPASGAALERLSADIATKHEAAMASVSRDAAITRAVDEVAVGAPSRQTVEAFHGTLEKFDVFDPAKLGAETGSEDAKLGFYFTDNAKVAEGYAAPDNPYDRKIFTGKLGRAYVALNEALVKLIRGRGLIGKPGQILRARLTFENPLVYDAGGAEMSGAARAEVLRQAKADGHDGVVFQNSRDPGYTDASDIPANVYVSFDPKKVDIVSWHKNAADAEAAVMTPTNMAPADALALDRAALDEPTMRMLADGPVTAPDNRGFVQRFLANLPANERASVADAAGNLSKDGIRRVENAIVASAFGDDAGIISRFAEATDDATRSVVGALSDVAGKWALMRRAIKAGELSPEFDVTPELTSGLRKLSAWRDTAAREGRPVSTVIKEGMGQLDMLDGEMSLEAKTMIRAFYKTDEFKQGAGRDAIASRLGKIVDAINHEGRPQLFADAEALTKLGVLEHAIDRSEADLFAAADAGTGTDGLRQSRGQRPAGADRGNGAEGTGVDQGSRPERSGADAAGLTDQKVLPFPERAPATDMSPPRPRAIPEGLSAAGERVGKPDDYRAVAAQEGVGEDGSFPEQMDIDQMREAGQLTALDEKLLTAADDNAKEAELYGKSLLAAANCVSRTL